ncbi:MAG: type IV toxin-antitoxin system AbiEi family antitoxin [Sandaracinus sp.]
MRADEPLRPYLAQLERLPFVRRAETRPVGRGAADSSLDGVVQLTTPTGKVKLGVEVKRTHLTRAMAEHVVQRAAGAEDLIVMAPSVGRELADFFAQHRINFVDLAGNCFVRLGEQYLAQVEGRRAELRAPTEKALRAPAYRVVFALLADPALVQATARALAEAAGGVSPQTANDVRARLLAGGVIVKSRGRMQWAPGRRKQALETFLLGFSMLTPSLVLGRFRARQRTPEALEAELTPRLAALGEWRWGGGAGAHRLTGYYRGDRTVIYVRKPDVAALRKLPLIPDPTGEVTLVQAPGPRAFEGPNAEVVHPLLVYADLLAEGHDRAREAAAEIYETYLAEGFA